MARFREHDKFFQKNVNKVSISISCLVPLYDAGIAATRTRRNLRATATVSAPGLFPPMRLRRRFLRLLRDVPGPPTAFDRDSDAEAGARFRSFFQDGATV